MKKKYDKSSKVSKYETRVGRSSAGLGLYALDPIKKGSFIIEYYGPIMNEEESDRIGGKYLFSITKKRVINGAPRYNKARYINHSCGPNAESKYIKNKYVYIKAIKNIKAGEEITYDYGEEYFDDYIKPQGCKCIKCSKKKAKK